MYVMIHGLLLSTSSPDVYLKTTGPQPSRAFRCIHPIAWPIAFPCSLLSFSILPSLSSFIHQFFPSLPRSSSLGIPKTHSLRSFLSSGVAVFPVISLLSPLPYPLCSQCSRPKALLSILPASVLVPCVGGLSFVPLHLTSLSSGIARSALT